MFREDNYIYYRPDNNSTNHADTAERPLKKKELLKEFKSASDNTQNND